MDNHYHLLIETTRDKLSHALRYINSNYAIYYNKKYKREGHLWQGRFQSSYITSETYLFTLLRYIEQNPLKAGIVKKLGDYEYISYKHFISNSPNTCLLNSFIYDRFETKKEIAEFLNEVVDEESEQKTLQEIRSQKVEIKEEKDRVSKPLRDYFDKTQTKEQRDIQIYQAYQGGWSQGKIAKEVGISQPAVFKVVKKLKERN
jgi:predicted transcriptional regulator